MEPPEGVKRAREVLRRACERRGHEIKDWAIACECGEKVRASYVRRDVAEEALLALDHAVDIIDLYDEYLVNKHEDPERIYSDTHLKGKKKMRRAAKRLREALEPVEGDNRDRLI